MKHQEIMGLVKAALEVAVADGKLARAEMGVVEGLAARAGIGKTSFNAMLEAAKREDTRGDNLLIQSPDNASKALELLIGEARIDGDISDEELELLLRIGERLGITGDDFQAVYRAGIERADRIRKSRS